jgi:quaternary ammonium compound-resistance protein SugE
MAWIYLLIAGIMEIGWAIGLKYTEGWSKPVPSILTISAMIVSFWFLSLALRTLPIGTAYGIWTGIGTAGTVILGMVLFNEPMEILRLTCLALIITGVVGLRLVTGH